MLKDPGIDQMQGFRRPLNWLAVSVAVIQRDVVAIFVRFLIE
jgi:hypothetical protein